MKYLFLEFSINTVKACLIRVIENIETVYTSPVLDLWTLLLYHQAHPPASHLLLKCYHDPQFFTVGDPSTSGRKRVTWTPRVCALSSWSGCCDWLVSLWSILEDSLHL
jgi:hypothetical protein